jgi:hypothetical protein
LFRAIFDLSFSSYLVSRDPGAHSQSVKADQTQDFWSMREGSAECVTFYIMPAKSGNSHVIHCPQTDRRLTHSRDETTQMPCILLECKDSA